MRYNLAFTLSLALLAAAPHDAGQSAPTFDLVIRNGTVVDGSGGRRFRADVGITGDRIAAVGNLAGRAARDTIDAEGLMVAPGFINLHSHAEPRGLQTADNMLSQGVTTEILNADGSGPPDIAVQLRSLDSTGIALNVGANVGFNSVWSAVVGNTDRRPAVDEIAQMQRMIVGNLERGAFGVSAGLDYKPAYFATEDEVVRILEPVRKWRTNFPNHDRVTPEAHYSARAAVRETMRIGERAGLVPVVTHMKVTGRERGTGQVILDEMTAATRRGIYTAADVYPYLSGLTGLGALTLPAWALDGGPAEMRRRFADPGQRRRIVVEADETIAARFTGPDGILVLSTRRYLSDYMKEFGTTSPAEAIVRIMETGSPPAILGFGEESDLVRILKHPSAAVSCDCGATSGATGHPRNYGTFPRVLGRYVRQQKQLTWENAIRKMTALPATMAGIIDRGYLAVGMHADVAVFDTASIIDHATFEQPGLRSEGMRHVIVNGRIALEDGQPTGARAGRALYRGSWMPSRPMTPHTAPRRVTLRAVAQPTGDDGQPMRITVDVSQAAGARAATGTLRLERPDSGEDALEAVSLGVLQSGEKWASVSGRMRQRRSGEERGFTLTIERADPFVDGAPQTVTLQGEGAPTMRAVVR